MTDLPVRPGYIFVGGAPRSGTTLLQNMLDSHPDIIGGPEFLHLPDIMRLRRMMRRTLGNGWLDEYCSPAEADAHLRQLIDNFLLAIAGNRPAAYISEKTPANIQVFADLADLYPDARFIQIVRDPRAVVASMLKVGRRARQKGIQTQAFTRSLVDAVHYVSACYADGMTFQPRGASTFLTVSYEDLVRDPGGLTRRICAFLDLPWDPKMLRPDQVEHAGEKAITNDVWYSQEEYKRRPTDNAVDKWKDSLSFAQQAILYYCFSGNQPVRANGYRLEKEFSSSLTGTPFYWVGCVLYAFLRMKTKIINQVKSLTRILAIH
ncbi:sulfotransferase family protein [Desulfosarcina sp.]|uniref:sulfotransferase family protein n=1 Tax=Desulfosarcina sp. TaxID=2027861 RepID=UPI0039707CE4